MTDIEVIVENGGLKELPKIKKKPVKEKDLVRGTTDEGMIQREFDEPAYQVKGSEQQEEKTQNTRTIEESIKKVEVSKNEKPKEDTQLIIQETYKQKSLQKSEVSEQKYLPGMQFIEHIGVGGMCEVERVRDNSGLEFAFKGLNERTMQIASISDADARRKALKLLREEAKTINELAKKGSKHTPQFALDSTFSENPGIYVKYVPSSLEERIEKGINPQEAVSLFLQMTEPIKTLHEKHIALMDIKPSNYRLDENGIPILVDLNLKRVKEAYRTSDSLMLSCVTDSGKTIGTPLYMSPEQEEGKIQNGKEHLVDIYQLSSSLYQLLTGMRPAGHPDSLLDFDKIKSNFGEDKTRKLNVLIERSRSRNIEKRPQSVDDLVREVKDILGFEERGEGKSSSREEELKDKVNELERQLNSLDNSFRNDAKTKHLLTEREYTAMIKDVLKDNNHLFIEGDYYSDIVDFDKEGKTAKVLGHLSFRKTNEDGEWVPEKIKLGIYGRENLDKMKDLAEKISAATGLEIITSLFSKDCYFSKRYTRKLIKQNTLEEKATQVNVGNLEVASEVTKSIYNVAKNIAKYTFLTITAPLNVPTIIRRIYDYNKEGDLGVFSLFNFIASTTSPFIIARYHGKEAGLITGGLILATNAISGVYEIVRHSRNKLLERKKEEIEKRIKNAKPEKLEEMIANVRQGDFSILLNDKKFRSYNEKIDESRSRFLSLFGAYSGKKYMEDNFINKLIINGIAYNEIHAGKIISALQEKGIPTLVGSYILIERTDHKGRKLYKFDFQLSEKERSEIKKREENREFQRRIDSTL